MRDLFFCLLLLLTGAPTWASDTGPWRTATQAEQSLDAAAFAEMDQRITNSYGDVQSAVVVMQGRKVYEFQRSGNPAALHPMHSVAKSALALLVGTALQRGQLTSLDQAVLDLMPEWAALNSSPHAAAITLRHLLAMTAGFDIDNDPTGTARALAPTAAWARTIGAAPGSRFAYDNSLQLMTAAILEKVTGQPLATLASDQLFKPLDMQSPSLNSARLSLRTDDMAKLGMLLLSEGNWDGQALLPAGFTRELTEPLSRGGPPAGLPYGLGWWLPSPNTAIASGYGGQLVFVHPPLQLVIAVTSATSAQGAVRGQALKLARGPLFGAAVKRAKAGSGS